MSDTTIDLEKSNSGPSLGKSDSGSIGGPSGPGDGPSGQPPKSGPGRLIGIIVAILVIGGLIYFFFSNKASDQARDSFTLLMNKIAGPGNWTVKKVSFGLVSKTIEASDLSIDLKAANKALTNPLTIKTVKIKNPLERGPLDELLAAVDWRAQPETRLADSVVLSGIALDVPDQKAVAAFRVQEMIYEGLSLAAAPASNIPGIYGFAKSARIQKITGTGFALNLAGEDKSLLTASLSKTELTNWRVSPDAGELGNFYQLFTNLVIDKQLLSNLAINYADSGGRENLKMAIDEHHITGSNKFRYETVGYKNMSMEMNLLPDPDADKPINIAMKLDDMKFVDIDLMPMIDRVFNTVNLSGSSEEVEAAMSRFSTVADLFTLPYSLGSAEASGFSFSLDSALQVALDKAAYQGPSEARTIPPAQNWSIAGLRVDLPTEETEPYLAKALAFGRDFGQSSFVAHSEVATTYDAETGTLIYAGKPVLEVADLAVLNVDFGLTNLTPSLIEALGEIPMIEAENAIFLSEFYLLGVTKLKIEIADNSLIDKILALYAARNNSDKEVLRAIASNSVQTMMMFVEDRLANAAEIGALASEFIKSPGKLVIEVTPSEPFSVTTVYNATSESEMLNQLNATVTVNDNSPVTLIFTEPPAQPAEEGEGIGEDDLELPEGIDGSEDIETLDGLEDLSMAPGAIPAALVAASNASAQ